MGISYSGFGSGVANISGLVVSPPGALTAKYNNAPNWITPSGSLGAANGGIAYTFNFQTSDDENDVITFSLISGTLPTGISLSGNQLTGTPVNNPATYNFTISISDGNYSVNRSFTLDVTNDTPIWNTAAGALGNISNGTIGSYTLSATDPNGDIITYSISSGSLPTGMTISGNVISGTPTTIGTNNFTITASDGKGGSVARAFTINVISAAPTWITASNIGTFIQGDPLNFNVLATDDDSTVSYSLVSSDLTLTVNSTTGNVFGTAPPVSQVDIPIWSTTAGSLGAYNEMSTATINLSASAVAPNTIRTYAVVNGYLPWGLTLSSTGVISGTIEETTTNEPEYETTPKPIWSTTAGSLGTFNMNAVVNTTVVATLSGSTITNYTVIDGYLPWGLTLSSAGAISGTLSAVPSTTTYNFTIKAISATGSYSNNNFSITVNKI